MILDEPTNHLDVDSREMLIRAINEFEGATIIISHDRHLLEATIDRLWLVRDGTVTSYEGDIEDYRAACLVERTEQRRGKAGSISPHESATIRPADVRRQAAAQRALIAPLKKEMSKWEKLVENLTRKISEIDGLLSDVDLYDREPNKAQELAKNRGLLARELEEAEDAWLEATSRYEDAKS